METYKPEPQKQVRKIPNATLPLLWADSLEVNYTPQNVTMRFSADLPEFQMEVVRIQTPVEHVKKMVDMFCKSLNYYPENPDKIIAKKEETE